MRTPPLPPPPSYYLAKDVIVSGRKVELCKLEGRKDLSLKQRWQMKTSKFHAYIQMLLGISSHETSNSLWVRYRQNYTI